MEQRILLKKRLIHKILDKVTAKKLFHRKRASRYKMIDDLSDTVIVFFSTITTTSIVISIATVNPVVAIVSMVSSSIALIVSAMKSKLNIRTKWARSNNVAMNLNDLNREILIVLARNNLSSSDLDHILNDIHHRLSLIEESEPLTHVVAGSDVGRTITPMDHTEVNVHFTATE